MSKKAQRTKKKSVRKGPSAAKPGAKAKKKTATARPPAASKSRSKPAGRRAKAGGEGAAGASKESPVDQTPAPEAPRGFTLGDHTFLAPSQPSDSFARWEAPKRQIKGAPPPTCLDGLVREAGPDSIAARSLRDGAWCGHGEPTLSLFDVVIDGQDLLEISVIDDPEDTERECNHLAIVVRPPGGQEWKPVFRREWEDRQETLQGVSFTPLSAKEAAAVARKSMRGRVSVGLEYPCDAESRDTVSWIEIHAVPEGKTEYLRLASAELA